MQSQSAVPIDYMGERIYRNILILCGNEHLDNTFVAKAQRVVPSYDANRFEDCVVKCFRRPLQGRAKRHLRREALALRKVCSPYVTALREVFVSTTHVHIAMEYMDGGTLRSYVREHVHGLDELEAQRVFRKTLLGVRDLHSLDIANRDIKATNILLDRSRRIIKICDLGFAKLESKSCRTKLGTCTYAAPEILNLSAYNNHNAPYDGKCADVWSLGVTLYFMLFNKYPFVVDGVHHEADCLWDATKEIVAICDLDFPRHISESCKDVLYRIFVKDPQKRITVNELLDHRWIRAGMENVFLEDQTAINYCIQSEEQIERLLDYSVIDSIDTVVDLTNDDQSSLNVERGNIC